jgi:hypothetical protein
MGAGTSKIPARSGTRRSLSGSPHRGAISLAREASPAPTTRPSEVNDPIGAIIWDRQNGSAAQRRTTPNPRLIGDHSGLSAHYETSGTGDPGRVSSGKDDPGGVSYGIPQFSSTKGTARRFVESPEAMRWANDFRGLVPGTSEFSNAWRRVAAREPGDFGAAQNAFVRRTHFERAVNGVLHRTGLNLDGSSEALRQVTYSVAVQHGGSIEILSDAVRRTDQHVNRSNVGYQTALINAIYDRRIEYVSALRDKAQLEKRNGDARTYSNVIANRYPRERADALRMLTREN